MGYYKLSIIIPVYNEERTVSKLLRKVIDLKVPLEKEIICVDDGSTDRSAEIIKQIMEENQDTEIKYFFKNNAGKGSAVRMGFSLASGDILVIQDADLEYDPEDFNKMLTEILEKGYKVVYGSRYLCDCGHFKENNHAVFRLHKVGNQMLSLVTSMLYWQRITDMETCYKMFTKEVYEKMRLVSNDFKIEPEMTSYILKRGYKIKEVPISYFSRDFSEGKKITWRDGILALWHLIKLKVTI